MSELIVHSPGLSTTVQDTGRDGFYEIGMPPSGAMDQFSHRAANLLVGNPEGAATLEATYIGPKLEFTDSRIVAVTGAEAPLSLNGEPVPTWEAFAVKPGDVLSFAMITAGARPYIAVSGGIAVPEYLGSRSTYTLTGLGGLDGRKLAEGDRLPLGEASGARPGVRVPDELRPEHPSVTPLRTVVGLCSYRLTDAGMESFLGTEWKITKDADRVGYRLRGGKLDFVEREQPFGAGSDPANVVDLGYPVGSIQVPGGDEPIVLLNDAVTGGGYATIGTVVSADRDRIAQARTGDLVSFVPVDLAAALAARRDRRSRLDRIKSLVS
ncbi:biotin-dependent carboxyltransferase family protein [Amycolatopsis acidiphila]|uniref:Biotin-dependent carboxyltransferase family protein n=1 Tax=Amycolatopsis acidiphila TaxID=715473 RepID=A0A558A4I9_9PSEU|nr:biotin-dependent carboxyltransferase family protein [Amycolatopsis acidiphila]TVT19179.1 biotin-dependent carboxyltransferase family protein [Amycolatopsis acidiphila]UIJ61993.1 biotin-dependent carboxyltransferase family protein [Amycolatopsis acidiphila]GHG56719.1 allophanate hydrolase [Amycolatopsis acidiphila]